MIKELEDFVQNLLNENFFEAHEDLESIWFARRFDTHPEPKLWRCLINAAVSFELHKKGRYDAAARVWQNYIKYKNYIGEVEDKKIYTKAISVIEQIHKSKKGTK